MQLRLRLWIALAFSCACSGVSSDIGDARGESQPLVCTAPSIPAPAPPPTLAASAALTHPLIYATDAHPYVMNALLASYNGAPTTPPLVKLSGTGFSCTDQVTVVQNGAATVIAPSNISASYVQFNLPVSLLGVPGTLHLSVGRKEGAATLSPSGSDYSAAGMLLHFAGLPGTSYAVRASTDLVTWTTLANVTADVNGHFQYLDTAAKNYSARFYEAVGEADSGTIDLVVVQAIVPRAPGSLVASESVTCAKVNGGVQCWGDNRSGELGNNANCPTENNGNFLDPTCDHSAVPVQVFGLTSGVTAIGIGPQHVCAIKNGAVYCWGANDYGQLGVDPVATANEDGSSYSRVPVSVPFIGNATALALGATHTCALVAGGVQCWGDNGFGQLGIAYDVSNPDSWSSFLPVSARGVGSNVQAITSGDEHTCALISGSVYCWGANAKSQLGDGTPDANDLVQVTSLLPGTTAIAAGGLHTCALGVDGSVYCWGNNTSGEIGRNPPFTLSGTNVPGTSKSANALLVNASSSSSTAIASGASDSCAIFRGTLGCWGGNSSAQAGNPLASYQGQGFALPLVAVQGFSAAIDDFVIGAFHGCALSNGAVQCWAADNLGQLGNNLTTNSCLSGTCVPQMVWGLQGQVSETLAFAQTAYSSPAGAATVVATVNRTGLGAACSVSYMTSDIEAVAGTDYSATSGTLSFGANEMSKTITVPVHNGSPGAKRFALTLSNPSTNASVASPPSVMVTLAAPPVIGFNAGAFPAPATTGTATLTLARSPATGPGSVNWATRGGGPSGVASFNDGVATVNFTVPVTHGAGTTFTYVDLSSPSGGAMLGLAEAIITVNSAAQIQFDGSSVYYSAAVGSGTASLLVDRSFSTEAAVDVYYNTTTTGATNPAAPGTDYSPVTGGHVHWNAGDGAQKTINITVYHPQGTTTKSFLVQLYIQAGTMLPPLLGANATATVYVAPSPPPPMVSLGTSYVGALREGETVQLPVVLSSPAPSTASVNWSISGGAIQGVDYSAGPSGTVTFNAGDTVKYINVPIIGWNAPGNTCPGGVATVPPQRALTVTLSGGSGIVLGGNTAATISIETMTILYHSATIPDPGVSYAGQTTYYTRTGNLTGPTSIRVSARQFGNNVWTEFAATTLSWGDGEGGQQSWHYTWPLTSLYLHPVEDWGLNSPAGALYGNVTGVPLPCSPGTL